MTRLPVVTNSRGLIYINIPQSFHKGMVLKAISETAYLRVINATQQFHMDDIKHTVGNPHSASFPTVHIAMRDAPDPPTGHNGLDSLA
jgi:hypothetical protein